MNAAYIRTVQLLLDVAPAVFASSAFAMKGGTAVNVDSVTISGTTGQHGATLP